MRVRCRDEFEIMAMAMGSSNDEKTGELDLGQLTLERAPDACSSLLVAMDVNDRVYPREPETFFC